MNIKQPTETCDHCNCWLEKPDWKRHKVGSLPFWQFTAECQHCGFVNIRTKKKARKL